MLGIFTAPALPALLLWHLILMAGWLWAMMLSQGVVLPQDISLRTDPAESPLPPDDTLAALHEAAARLSAVPGVSIDAAPMGVEARGELCRLIWFRGFGISLDVIARGGRDPDCQVQVRRGANGVSTPADLTCVVMHELGHLLVGEVWHSEDPGSFMADRWYYGRPCPVTADFAEMVTRPR